MKGVPDEWKPEAVRDADGRFHSVLTKTITLSNGREVGISCDTAILRHSTRSAIEELNAAEVELRAASEARLP